MILLKSHIKPAGSGLLYDGDHIVRIDSVGETLSPEHHMTWDDRTPQISVRFKNSKGFITHWFNVMGYMTKEDYESTAIFNGIVFKKHPYNGIEYAVDAFTNRRIENTTKTKICLQILGRLGHCAGIEKDKIFELADLVNLELAIRVNNQKVIKTFKKQTI